MSEEPAGTNGLVPTPPTEGCCLNPAVFGGGGGGVRAGEAKAPMLAHRDNSFRLDLINFSAKGPHPMFSPFVVL